MPRNPSRSGLGLGMIALVAALAPAAPQQPSTPPPASPAPAPALGDDTPAARGRARAEAGARTFDLVWLYYSENRVDADTVYRWSRRAYEADRDAAPDRAGRLAAAEAHLGRMARLEAKIERIRRLGFGTSLDVASADYYLKEAEAWRHEGRAP